MLATKTTTLAGGTFISILNSTILKVIQRTLLTIPPSWGEEII
jgi:TRAP-type C4-dicarboxylate transport system permease small subunit